MALFEKTIIPSQFTRSFEQVETSFEQKTAPKLTLAQLRSNFRAVFPNSNFLNLKIEDLKVTGAETLILRITSQIRSSTKQHAYMDRIVLRRKSHDIEWNTNLLAEVRCTCKAFRYYNAYPDLRTKNFAGKPTAWNKVRNKVKNPELISTGCKHLVFLTDQLIKRNVLKR